MSKFSISIQEWYLQNQRDLPWRNTENPYKIWLSEIILQQTRVNQGMSYYHKFIDHYPTVFKLAEASEQDVLNDWQGLGYYSRARNLHHAAKQIVTEFQGRFPSTYPNIKKLKGVGDYTAAAIASFAFHLPHAVVDGNVYRVLSRYLGITTPIDSSQGKKEFNHAAVELLDTENPNIHNQAIMELGALVCTPKKPDCENCPLNTSCFAFNEKRQFDFPVKSKKVKVKKKIHHYFLIVDRGEAQIIIRKRASDGIWKNMYDFPAIETDKSIQKEDRKKLLHHLTTSTGPVKKISSLKHKLSHREINATFYLLEGDIKNMLPEHHKSISINNLEDYPLPRLIDKFLGENRAIFTH